MFYYGFTFCPNKSNGIYIDLWFNKGDPLRKTKALLLGCESEDYITQLVYYEDFEEHYRENSMLLQYLRFIQYEGDPDLLCKCLDPSVSSIATCKRDKRELIVNPISKKNEVSTLKKLKDMCTRSLSKYKEAYEIDEELLRAKELTYNERNCIIYRMGEKKVLNEMIELANEGLTLLSKKYKAGINSLKNKSKYSKYLQDIIKFLK